MSGGGTKLQPRSDLEMLGCDLETRGGSPASPQLAAQKKQQQRLQPSKPKRRSPSSPPKRKVSSPSTPTSPPAMEPHAWRQPNTHGLVQYAAGGCGPADARHPDPVVHSPAAASRSKVYIGANHLGAAFGGVVGPQQDI